MPSTVTCSVSLTLWGVLPVLVGCACVWQAVVRVRPDFCQIICQLCPASLVGLEAGYALSRSSPFFSACLVVLSRFHLMLCCPVLLLLLLLQTTALISFVVLLFGTAHCFFALCLPLLPSAPLSSPPADPGFAIFILVLVVVAGDSKFMTTFGQNICWQRQAALAAIAD